ncbi:MAG TPA: hypothetical protein VM536_23265, partial [Chloroflexia bacterium]|nr:hypothetical protein [Chloroflexia bacterium]
MAAETMLLYRPVGLAEMELILNADSPGFPPRLPQQPIFYPVLTLDYAQQIAERWNAGDPNSGYAGFVTRFGVDLAYASRYAEHVVGTSIHRELWVPAEELVEFNRHLRSPIELIAAYYGDRYSGPVPKPYQLR